MAIQIIRLEQTKGKLIEYEIDRMEKFYWISVILGAIMLGIGMII